MSVPAEAVLKVARSQLGYNEVPVNRTKYGAWYGLNGQAWCDMFQSWCASQAGAASIIGKFAYTPSHAAWFQSRGQWGHRPRVGALVFYSWDGNGIDHVGIVEAVYPDGSILTIEGNTNAGGASRTGGGVRRVHRAASNLIVGYGYPAYGKSSYTTVGGTAWPQVQLGSKGTAVRHLQARLGLTADGIFGRETLAAVRSFQSHHGLAVDGVVGKLTWKAIG